MIAVRVQTFKVAPMSQSQQCPACSQRFQTRLVVNALSRFAYTYICKPCAQREAAEHFFWRAKAAERNLAFTVLGKEAVATAAA
jgi:hypothetical protein